MDIAQFEGRKRDHIRFSLDAANQAPQGRTSLDALQLPHEALPDLDLAEVSLASTAFGRPTATPLYVAGMTAGHADAYRLNRELALACARRGWAMGVGSQRRQLEETGSEALDQWVKLRAEVPKLTLIANLGLSQLLGLETARVRALVDALDAQALAVHANALQEALQPEGTPSFRGAEAELRRVVRELGRPVVLKETGCGFSRPTLERLRDVGLAAVDVSGRGGTHWGRIEGARARDGERGATREGRRLGQAAETFADWGVPTADTVAHAAAVFGTEGKTEIWASGGVRSGLDAAKLIALGARQVGFAKPALEAALAGPEELDRWMERIEFELRVALFCTGFAEPERLRRARVFDPSAAQGVRA
jgi:isopentenyl-diphosphate delta-isomerase